MIGYYNNHNTLCLIKSVLGFSLIGCRRDNGSFVVLLVPNKRVFRIQVNYVNAFSACKFYDLPRSVDGLLELNVLNTFLVA